MPPLDALAGRGGNVRITCHACHPLDVCPSICAQGAESLHIAVVRFSSMRDFRNESFRYGHLRGDQLFLRTTYFQSFEKLAADINASIGESLNQEGLIYTPGVGVLRGPIDEGALWFQEPTRADVRVGNWQWAPPFSQVSLDREDREGCVALVLPCSMLLWTGAVDPCRVPVPMQASGAEGPLTPSTQRTWRAPL